MASYHCSVKAGPKGKAAAHADYITRTGKYANTTRYEDLIATGHGNMPVWAAHNPSHFWQASDNYERANGTAYREIEVALPRELTEAQQRYLITIFVALEFDTHHAYQWAIHCPKAALEKGDQPHAHIMYCERIQDGIERDPNQYFKRYNAKAPERGGCRKQPGGTPTERKAQLVALRKRWAQLQNRHLWRHGYAARVDHRRLEEQGVEREPERHLGGRGVRQLSEADTQVLLEHRTAERAHHEAQDDVDDLINLNHALAAAQKAKEAAAAEKARLERLALEEAVAEAARAAAEQARLDNMTRWELEAEIERISPPPFNDAVTYHPNILAAQRTHDELASYMTGLHQRFLLAGEEAAAWRETHPLRAKLHDSSVKRAAFLAERQRIQQASRDEHIQLEPKLAESQAALDVVHERVHAEIVKAHAPRNAQVAVLRERLADYRKIDLYPLLEANGAPLVQSQPDKAWFDPKKQVIHTIPQDIVVERISQQLAEAYASWRVVNRKNLPETQHAAYHAALVNELGICTHLFRKTPDLPIPAKTAAMARNDVQRMVKKLESANRSRYRSRSRSWSRERSRDDSDLER